jgi:hypothetical protein
MSELQVKGNKFYMLTKKEGKEQEIRLYADMDTPVKRIKEWPKEGVEPEKPELVSAEIKEDKYEIKGIPWSIIASKLVKEA